MQEQALGDMRAKGINMSLLSSGVLKVGRNSTTTTKKKKLLKLPKQRPGVVHRRRTAALEKGSDKLL